MKVCQQTIPHDLYSLGYTQQICIDFSAVVIKQMRERYASDTEINWKYGDVRNLSEPDCSVDIAFDKGTLDAMIFGSPWDPPESVRENTRRYVDEVSAVVISGFRVSSVVQLIDNALLIEDQRLQGY